MQIQLQSGITETSLDSPKTSDTPDTSQSPKPTESSYWTITSLFDLFGTSTNTTKNLEESRTGSGSVGDDSDDGSGIEKSSIRTSIVQPIDWSGVTEISSDSPETSDTPDTTQSPKPTEINHYFKQYQSTTVTTTTDDPNLDQDEFSPVSITSKSQELTSTISNNETVLLNVNNNGNPIKIINDNNELPDASSAVQTKMSYASYYILVGLLLV
ncbi:hypothetical protein HCN44_006051 [Aphidius gifuensis]|uniref:Uncharacterized protein n=1 Tax=Aphidius gifuensis TaxID=684658 RepID=A0A834Y3P0_APHGI|nr:hypothetical protein HCN44_006051 [Aphidius gifuensis]